MLMLLFFFQKNQNTKNKKKIKMDKGTKSEKKEIEGPNYFFCYLVTKLSWRPSN